MIKKISFVITLTALLLGMASNVNAGVFNDFTDWKDMIDKLEPRTGAFIDFADSETGTLSAISLYTFSTDSEGKALKVGGIDIGYLYPDKGFAGINVDSEFLEKFKIDVQIPIIGKVHVEAWAGATYDFDVKAAGGGVGASILKHF